MIVDFIKLNHFKLISVLSNYVSEEMLDEANVMMKVSKHNHITTYKEF